MPINMLEWLAGPPGGYMDGTHNLVTRIYPSRLVWIKSAKQGFPTDVWGLKNGQLTFFQTENGDPKDGNNGWKNVKSFKINTNNLPVFCPLQPPSLPISAAPPINVTHEDYVNGVWDGKWNQLSDANCLISNLIYIDWGGDVKVQDTMHLRWMYGKKNANGLNPVAEVYSLCKGFGQVAWDEMHLDADGLYRTTNRSVFNKFVKCDPLPDPVFGFPASWLP